MALVAGRALQWHWLDWEGPEQTEQWNKKVSFWVGLAFCRGGFLEYPLLASSLFLLLS